MLDMKLEWHENKQALVPRRPNEDSIPERAKSNNKRLVLLMLASAVPFGIIEGLLGLPEHEPRVLILAEGVGINFIFFYWFMVDSQIRNYDASGFLKFLVVVFGPIALFLYIIRTRGVKASIKSLVYALGLIFLAAGTGAIVGLVTSVLIAHDVLSSNN